MPANALAIFEGAVPAHVAAANEAANIIPRASTNSLTFEGKVWTINLDGKKTKLTKKDDDGEDQPVQIFTGIILDYTKARGREWFKGAYDASKPALPDCWSEDGNKPEANVPHPVSATCAACPKSKKNSQISADGKGTVACSQFRKLAIVPAAQIGTFPPLRMKFKITSDWDGANAEKNAATGWYAYQQYLDLLTSKNIRHTALLPTKIKFDMTTAYPKLLFSPGKSWVPEEVFVDIIKPLSESDEVKELLAKSYDPANEKVGTKPLPSSDDEDETEVVSVAAKPAAAKPAAKPAAPAPVAVAENEDDEGITIEGTAVEEVAEEEEVVLTAEQMAAAKRAAKAEQASKVAAANVAKAGAKAAAGKAAAVAALPDEDEDEVVVAPPKAAGKPAAAAAATPAKPAGKTAAAPPKGPVNAPPDVAGMIQDWDE